MVHMVKNICWARPNILAGHGQTMPWVLDHFRPMPKERIRFLEDFSYQNWKLITSFVTHFQKWSIFSCIKAFLPKLKIFFIDRKWTGNLEFILPVENLPASKKTSFRLDIFRASVFKFSWFSKNISQNHDKKVLLKSWERLDIIIFAFLLNRKRQRNHSIRMVTLPCLQSSL